jgi:hypothetical protein
VVTRIEWDGTMQRRMVDTAGRIDGAQWEELAARALAVLPLYRPVPRIPVYHISVDDAVIQAAEHDLTGALLDLITAVLAFGEELLPQHARQGFAGHSPGLWKAAWPAPAGALSAGVAAGARCRCRARHPAALRVGGWSAGVAKPSHRAMIGR